MTALPRTRQLLKQLPPPRRVLAKAHPFLKSQFKHIPFPLQQRVMEKVMATGFREAIQDGELDFLQRRWLCIEIDDLGIRWNITQGTQGPVMIKSAVQADVTICGKLRDFVALANQEEDPDTLFFQRRLRISGDTDLGLG